MSYSRYLCPIEEIVSMITINLMVSFESKTPIKQEDIIDAIRFTKQKYPYMRMKIIQDGIRHKIVDQTEDELDKIDIVWNNLDDEIDTTFSEKRFNMFTCREYDISKSVFYIEVDSFKSFYRLYFSMNHSCTDSRGCFAVLRDLLHNLDLIVAGERPSKIEPKPKLDLLTNLEHSFDLDKLRREAAFECEFHSNLAQLEYPDTDETRLGLYKINFLSEYAQLDERTTRSLVSNCKINRTSVQAVLSVANMITLMNESRSTSLSSKEAKSCLHSIPIDMRYHFGLAADDLIKGSAFLVWLQRLDANQELWEAARQSKDHLEKCKKEMGGLKWWVKTNNGIPRQPYTALESSIGLISFDEEKLKCIKITDLRFNNTKEPGNLIEIHAFTFADRFTISAGFRYPRFKPEWARNYLDNLVRVLQRFSNDSGPISIDSIIPLLQNFENK